MIAEAIGVFMFTYVLVALCQFTGRSGDDLNDY
jgi:hypothetical protein